MLPQVKRFTFTIDPKAAAQELLPPPPRALPEPRPPLGDDLAQVPEVLLQQPPEIELNKQQFEADLASNVKERIQKHHRQQAKLLEETAHQIAKINHLNQQKTDYFIEVLSSQRPDLSGLPFMTGDACRMKKERATPFSCAVTLVRQSLIAQDAGRSAAGFSFWKHFDTWEGNEAFARLPAQEFRAARMAALLQMLAPEAPALRTGLVDHLAKMKQPEATQALARLAVFSFEADVRQAAVAALRNRPHADYTAILLQGLRYPWPAVARNATDAMAELERTDLAPHLTAFLDEPDPRAPVMEEVKGEKVIAVRELVRINHHRNCLLCHAPGNTPDVLGVNRAFPQPNVIVGAVPIAGEGLPSSSAGYLSTSPDIFVRADVTYLRQDFSVMQKVADADGWWPQLQRFDFLVRKRILSEQQAHAYRDAYSQRDGAVSPYHEAALSALGRLQPSSPSDSQQTACRARPRVGGAARRGP
jgi:hypothetical protein